KGLDRVEPAPGPQVLVGPGSGAHLAGGRLDGPAVGDAGPTAIAVAPVLRSSSAARSAAAPCTSSRPTGSPRAARCRAIANPIPDAAPVTTATRSIVAIVQACLIGRVAIMD